MPNTFDLAIDVIDLPVGMRPQLFVVVDTEEEFDWSAPFSRANTSVRAMRHIDRLQRVLERYSVAPTYVIDFPIASQRDGWQPLKELADDGAATIGAHLHPWVNPPFVEELSRRASFGCALGAAIEAEKIRLLQQQIAASFGAPPTIYKAGRYGFGPTTADALEALGFTIDLSVNPRMDFTAEGGPTFAELNARPFFFGRMRRLLEIPCTTDYIGALGRVGHRIHPVISHRSLAPTRIVGVMSRLGALNKVMLSPEGSTLDEMKALTSALVARGVRTFSMTLHSPSVEPGCTPYVRSDGDLDRFLGRIAAYCEFFFGDLGGDAATPDEFRASLGAPPVTGVMADEGARALAAR